MVILTNLICPQYLQNKGLTTEPKISVLIPARNEESKIGDCLKSLLDQDYKNFEVIIYNDQSTDSTEQIIREFVKKYPGFSLIHGKNLPIGWLGKNYACHQLASAASGEYLFFIDADVQVSKGFFSAALGEMKSGVSIISVFNDQIIKGSGEFLTVPLMHYILLSLLPIRLVKNSTNPAFSAASGQCMAFTRENYMKEKWHEKVKELVVEDISIFKKAKEKGYVTAAFLANGYIKCHMYNSFTEAVNGFSKNFLAGFNNSIVVLLLFTLLEFLFFVPFFYWSTISAAGLVLSLFGKGIISYLSNQNILLNIVLQPIQLISLLYISITSVYRKITRTNKWKGRSIALNSV